MSWSRSEPAEWMTFAYSTCLAVRFRPGFCASSRARISRLFSGVRSSCDMFARNCDLYCEASASCLARAPRSLPWPARSPRSWPRCPLLGGQQRRLVLQVGVGPLQLLRPGLQLRRPRLQLGRQPLRLVEQRVGAGVGDDRVDADPERLGELLEEVDLDRRELGERRELDDAEHLGLEQDGHEARLAGGASPSPEEILM